jgi:hypothetical protein
MNTFLLDLWHDLRAKRLWPVAAVLVIALIAVPVVLKKSSDSGSSSVPPPAPTAASGAGADAGKAVVVADASTSNNSTLGVFNKKNPFKPDKSVIAAQNPPASTPAPAPSTPQSSAPSQGGGSTPSSGGGPPSGGTTPSQPVKPQAPKGPYAYTVDVKFGKRGLLRTHHDVQKLDVLPNQNNPLVVFLGVNTKGDTAVFLTDTSLKAAGEGTCKPNGDTCSFLYLKVDKDKNTEDLSEQSADGTGTEYTLQLLAIKKVLVSDLAQQAKKSARQARIAARRARVLHKQQPTPFNVPFGLHRLPDTVG